MKVNAALIADSVGAVISLPLSVRCQCEEFFLQLSSNGGWELVEVFGFGAEKGGGRIKTSAEQEVQSRNEVRLFSENLFLPTQKLSLLSRPTALRSNGTGKGVGSHYGSLWATATAAARSQLAANKLCTHAVLLQLNACSPLLTQKCSLCSQGPW